MEHYALVGNKTCGVSGMAAAAYRKKNTNTAMCLVGKGAKENGEINFHGKGTLFFALLSAQKQKATKTIISGLHLRPLELER